MYLEDSRVGPTMLHSLRVMATMIYLYWLPRIMTCFSPLHVCNVVGCFGCCLLSCTCSAQSGLGFLTLYVVSAFGALGDLFTFDFGRQLAVL